MRIIAGTAKGIPLVTPKGREIRPTLDRVRESVFNIIAPALDEETVFLDLFTGTGANGLEALSRGGARSVFVDSSPQSLEISRKNAAKARLSDRATFVRMTLPDNLSKVVRQHGPADIVYADPPFDFDAYEVLLKVIAEAEPHTPQQLVIVEHPSRTTLLEQVSGLNQYRTETYGRASISFYRRG
ncbi:MAG: 16S rRNA (guanine(966)-N(2))-methyltransferase RsmD [Candidatus Hydrogenedentota bacterium]